MGMETLETSWVSGGHWRESDRKLFLALLQGPQAYSSLWQLWGSRFAFKHKYLLVHFMRGIGTPKVSWWFCQLINLSNGLFSLAISFLICKMEATVLPGWCASCELWIRQYCQSHATYCLLQSAHLFCWYCFFGRGGILATGQARNGSGYLSIVFLWPCLLQFSLWRNKSNVLETWVEPWSWPLCSSFEI